VVLSRELSISTDQLLGLASPDARRAGESQGRYEVANPELQRLVNKLERVPVRHIRLLTRLAMALRSAAG
jgi:hypothetical protein